MKTFSTIILLLWWYIFYLDIILPPWCDIFYFDIILLPLWNIFYLNMTLLPWIDIFYLNVFLLPWCTRPFLLGWAFLYCFFRPWSELVSLYCQLRRWLGCSRVPCIFGLGIVQLAYGNRITDPSVRLWGWEKEEIASLAVCLSIFQKKKGKKRNIKKSMKFVYFLLNIVLGWRKIKHEIYGTEIGN